MGAVVMAYVVMGRLLWRKLTRDVRKHAPTASTWQITWDAVQVLLVASLYIARYGWPPSRNQASQEAQGAFRYKYEE